MFCPCPQRYKSHTLTPISAASKSGPAPTAAQSVLSPTTARFAGASHVGSPQPGATSANSSSAPVTCARCRQHPATQNCRQCTMNFCTGCATEAHQTQVGHHSNRPFFVCVVAFSCRSWHSCLCVSAFSISNDWCFPGNEKSFPRGVARATCCRRLAATAACGRFPDRHAAGATWPAGACGRGAPGARSFTTCHTTYDGHTPSSLASPAACHSNAANVNFDPRDNDWSVSVCFVRRSLHRLVSELCPCLLCLVWPR